MAVKLFAAIDVGSFELELSIYEMNMKGRIACIDHVRHVIGLGNDTYRDGVISKEMLDELCATLSGFSEIMQGYHVEAYRAYATSALREAKNRVIVLDQIKVRTGLEVTVLSNAEQRYLTYNAIPLWMPSFKEVVEEPCAIVDVGYGSTQISLYEKGLLIFTQNLGLGALRMQSTLDEFSYTGDVYQLAEELADNEMDTFRRYGSDSKNLKRILAIGDCILLFVAKVMHMPKAQVIRSEDFIRTYMEVRKTSANDMATNYGIPEEYAKLILPVAMIYYRFLINSDATEIYLPGVNLSDGMATEYANKQKLLPAASVNDFAQESLEAARRIRNRYLGNAEHSETLSDIAALLFDNMKKQHGLGKRSRLLLQMAAILHDCGKFINISLPGECSYCIVKSTEILGLSQQEQAILANVIRFNTIALPFDEKPEDVLTAESYRTVIKLTAILRLANALDRSHRQKIKDIRIALKDEQLQILVDSKADIALERGMLARKSDFFAQVFGITPVLKQKRKLG
ncbi:MAG: HD domain-containing protein [Lachnospiraceae bacterium]|nr:HD domain-containing protein [Lachnospiraceae bacterium]